MAEPLTERELLIARLVYRSTLDAFNEVLKVGFPRELAFQAAYNEPDAVIDQKLHEKLGLMLDRVAEEKAHAEK